MNPLIAKIAKTSTIKSADILSRSKFFTEKDVISTYIPVFNVALSGDLNGGLTPGLTTLAGASKMFKTGFSLVLAKSYLDKYDDAAILFYDSEFGSPQGYFKAFGVDTDRVLHVPVTNIEELKFDIMKQIDSLSREDHLMIIVDSIGNLASKKEVDDTLDGKSAADMTRAKQLKSLFRMVTPHLTIKDIPLIVINHVYSTMELYSKPVVGGGTGSVYSSDTIFIISRQQEKDGGELSGYNFVINVEKSRFVKEKSKIIVSISFVKGISKYSGLMEMALEAGAVVKPSQGWYSKVNLATGVVEDKKYRIKDTDNKEFWDSILTSPEFNKWVKDTYQMASNTMITDESIDEEIENA